jgi:ribose 5-phosphate isomerase
VVAAIRDYAGVVETGFFPTEATEAIIAAAVDDMRTSAD